MAGPLCAFAVGLAARIARPAAGLTRCFYRSPGSTIDGLVNLKVECRLALLAPVRLGCNTLTGMRIAVIPQGWPARQEYVCGLRVGTDVIEDPPASSAVLWSG